MSHFFRWLKKLIVICTFGAMLASAPTVIPRGWDAAHILLLNDAQRIARYRLASLSAQDYATHLEQALIVRDIELARSLLTLSDEQNVAISPELRRLVAEQEKWTAIAARNTADIWQGISSGRADSSLGLIAATASDFTLFGDIRDVIQQSLAWPEHDPVLLALAGTGLGLTLITVASGGTAAPVKVGLSLVKVARKSGRLSKNLGHQLVRITKNAIDSKAVGEVGARFSKLELKTLNRVQLDELTSASKRIVSPTASKQLLKSGRSVRRIAKNSSSKGALDALHHADSVSELSRLARLSDGLKGSFRASLRLLPDLGKSLYKLTSTLISLLLWLGSALIWLSTAAWYSLRLLMWLIVSLWRLL